MPDVLETYQRYRQIFIRRLEPLCGADSPDVVQEAAIDVWQRSRAGLVSRWDVALRARAHRCRDPRVDIGLPLSLPDAACLGETIDRRRRLRAAQRVLTAAELEVLLAEYERPRQRATIIRIARRRLRRAC